VYINSDTGLLENYDFHASPNYDQRPEKIDITGIVIHNISLPPGDFGGGWIDDLFLNKLDPQAHPYFEAIADVRVSAHVLIRRDGQIIQYVPFHQRAWHAGVSSWDGIERCNDFTVGIELEGSDDQSFESIQYVSLSALIHALCSCYPGLNTKRIKGHNDIAPVRKTDPGPYFDWEHLDILLNK